MAIECHGSQGGEGETGPAFEADSFVFLRAARRSAFVLPAIKYAIEEKSLIKIPQII